MSNWFLFIYLFLNCYSCVSALEKKVIHQTSFLLFLLLPDGMSMYMRGRRQPVQPNDKSSSCGVVVVMGVGPSFFKKLLTVKVHFFPLSYDER